MVQKFGEPFSTSAFYRSPGGAWNWFYYDHEDNYWNEAQTELDRTNKLIKVFRNTELTATFNWETEVFTRGTNWETAGSKAAVPLGKNPWDNY